MMAQRYNQPAEPSNDLIWGVPERLGGLVSQAQLAWVEINGGSAMSSPVVLITGALTGIGRATAVAFAKEGARVVVSGRREQKGKQLEKELRELGAEGEFVKANVLHDDDIRNLIDKTVTHVGRPR